MLSTNKDFLEKLLEYYDQKGYFKPNF